MRNTNAVVRKYVILLKNEVFSASEGGPIRRRKARFDCFAARRLQFWRLRVGRDNGKLDAQKGEGEGAHRGPTTF